MGIEPTMFNQRFAVFCLRPLGNTMPAHFKRFERLSDGLEPSVLPLHQKCINAACKIRTYKPLPADCLANSFLTISDMQHKRLRQDLNPHTVLPVTIGFQDRSLAQLGLHRHSTLNEIRTHNNRFVADRFIR